MTQAHFIAFEGIDCCGKTTQIGRLEKYLKENNIEVVTGKEPGSTGVGGALRRILKEPGISYKALNEAFADNPDFPPIPMHEQGRTSEAETLMFIAARAEYFEKIVKPTLEKGISFFSDRGPDSTTAYQGGGRYKGDPEKIAFIQQLNDFATQGFKPTITFLLDIPYHVMLQRIGSARKDFMEKQGPEFFKYTRQVYIQLAEDDPKRYVLINGEKTIDDIIKNDIKPVAKELYNI